MTDIQKDILVGLLFVAGILGLISGAFIISAIVFPASAMFGKRHFSNPVQS